MAEIGGAAVASLVEPAARELGNCIVVTIKRQFNYLCCLSSNIADLQEEARGLKDARDGLDQRVTTAKNNVEKILPRVDTWLEKANHEIEVTMVELDNEIKNMQSGCWAIKSRYSLSKKVRRTTEAMQQLRGSGEFDTISEPAPPAATALVPLGSIYDFKSRKDIEEDIVKALGKFNVVGICGMGGVGKTTMAKRVMHRVKKDGLFDETVMVVVSQKVNMSKIQNEVAENLGLKWEEESLSSRAHRLRTRLTDGKRILIVLDDIWENFELEDLGIPCENGSNSKGCKILLTSRNRLLLNSMDDQIKVCEIQTLSSEEALSLFKKKIGTCVDYPKLLLIGQDIVEECKGLPIALVSVGAVLKDQRETLFWESVRNQLKSYNPKDVPHFIAEVYNPLKLSYDSLDSEPEESKRAKSMFLLCCLFPEDSNIPLEYLTVSAMGLDMFGENTDLEQARNTTCLVVNRLKNRFLLLEGRDKDHVKMHDVVRDVAIFIASKDGLIKCNDCTWISPFLGQRIELSKTFPKLHLLLIDESADKELQVDDNFFGGMEELNVLYMDYYSLKSLPSTTSLLKNLRTLILHSCESLETIALIGELVNLEAFICRDCSSIKELPLEIGGLKCLRSLEVIKCQQLQTIAAGVISSLVGLEKLKIVKSFREWEAKDNKGKERKNARLSELESLSNLMCLEIEVRDPNLAAEEIRLSSKIVRFDIAIGQCGCWKIRSNKGSENVMHLHLPSESTPANWIIELLRHSEYTRLFLEGLSNLELRQLALQKVWRLSLKKCSAVEKLPNISDDEGRCGNTTAIVTVFPFLEILELEDLPELKGICDIEGPKGSKSCIAFENLKELILTQLPELKNLWKSTCQNVVSLCRNLSSIKINECHSLRHLFSFPMANDCLLQLKSLDIGNCKMMEQVFLWNEKKQEEENKKDIEQEICHHIRVFPKLKMLKLAHLPNLRTFYKGIESIEFPQLDVITIMKCPRLKGLVSGSTSPNVHGNNQKSSADISHDHDNDVLLHVFCGPEKVVFGSLKQVMIHGCENSGSNTLILWCHKISIDFFRGLAKLYIYDCGNIKNLFSSSIARNLVHLWALSIHDCPEMVKVIEDDEEEKYSHVCGGEMTYVFPLLEYLDLQNLPKLKNFCGCALEFPSLKDVKIEDCPKMERFTMGSLTTPKLETFYFGVNARSSHPKWKTFCFGVNERGSHEKEKKEENFYKWDAKRKGIMGGRGFDYDYEFEDAINLLNPEYSIYGSKRISFASDTRKHDITIGGSRDFGFSLVGFEKRMHLHLPREITLENWIHQCVRSVDYLLLEGEGLNNLDLGLAQNMRLLILRDCSKIMKLVNKTSSSIDDGRCDETTATAFPHLEYLGLQNLANLEEIFDIDGPISNEGSRSNRAFKNLKYLHLKNLPQLKPHCELSSNLSTVEIVSFHSLHYLFSSTVANDYFLQIESLEVTDFEMMEQVFLWNKEEGNKKDIGYESCHITIKFPKLKNLKLSKLPKLTSFCKGIENIEFPLLTKMEIINCPDLKSLVSSTTSSGCGNNPNDSGGFNHDDNVNDSLHLFCKPEKVAFPSLNELQIWGSKDVSILGCHQTSIDLFARIETLCIGHCGNINSLFSSSMAQNFLNLRSLTIWTCEKMIKVIEDANKEKLDACGDETPNSFFPKLKQIKLTSLPNLKSFCEWSCALELPSLERVSIYHCPEMERFSLGSLITPNLKGIGGEFDLIINRDENLNGTLQRRLSKSKEMGRRNEENVGRE